MTDLADRASGTGMVQAGIAVLLALALAIVAAPVSFAQTTSDTTSTVASNDRMPPSLSLGTFAGRTTRVILGARTLVCHSPQVTPAGIALPPSVPGGPGYAPPTLLPWEEVTRIDVRGNAAGAGAVVGAVTVGLLATALGAAIASDPFLGGDSDAGGIVAYTLAGTVSGAAVGALLGSSIPSWKTVYRRDAPADARSARSPSSRGSRP